jgi:hydroxymethylbilane synthase
VSRTLRLGTRGSALALLQAERVAGRLRREGIGVELVEIATTGDRDLALSVDELPSEAPFTDDIEAALRAGTIDIAVHCMKDLPLDPAEDLATAAVVDRADPREALISRNDQKLATLAPGARVGTSGLLRTLQIRRLRPDLEAVPIRGTVEERVRLVRQGRFEATVLAVAGLERLGLEAEIAERFPVETFVPAPGQGAIAVQVRAGDERALRVAASIDDPKAHRAAAAERWLQRAQPGRARDRGRGDRAVCEAPPHRRTPRARRARPGGPAGARGGRSGTAAGRSRTGPACDRSGERTLGDATPVRTEQATAASRRPAGMKQPESAVARYGSTRSGTSSSPCPPQGLFLFSCSRDYSR